VLDPTELFRGRKRGMIGRIRNLQDGPPLLVLLSGVKGKCMLIKGEVI
jgi:hypothetical protein